MFGKGTHASCVGCVIIASPCSKMGSISRIGRRSIYVLVDIYTVETDTDLLEAMPDSW